MQKRVNFENRVLGAYIISAMASILLYSCCTNKDMGTNMPNQQIIDNIQTGDLSWDSLSSQIMEMAMAFESQKLGNHNKYMNWTNQELYYSADTTYGFPDHNIKELKYITDGDSYSLYVISNYRVQKNMRLSVIKIQSGKIMWRDDVAELNDKIDDIDWGNVTFVVDNVRKDINGKYIVDLPFNYNLPDFIR